MLLCYIATHVHMGAYGMPMPQPNHAVPTYTVLSVKAAVPNKQAKVSGSVYIYVTLLVR